MPEHLRALVVIVVLASVVFFATERSCLTFVRQAEFKQWRNLWLATTLVAFLCQDFWLYVLVASFLTWFWAREYTNKAALFLLLLFVVPAGVIQVPGFGIINYLFNLNQPRLLALLLLLPCLVSLNRSLSGGGKISDALFLTYMLLIVVLEFRERTITDTARYAFQFFLDAALPYYVFSRSLKDIQAFRQAILCFVLSAMVIALIAIFEISRGWRLYSAMTGVLGLGYEEGYLGRADMLRASGPTGHPIILGYTMMVGIGFYLFLMSGVDSVMRRRSGLALLVGGLIAALSRGPWLGAIVLIGMFIATGREPFRRLMFFGLVLLLGLATLIILPGGDKVLDLLPYIGTVEAHTVDFREKLYENSMIVIQRNLWFGSVDYLQTPEMQDMKQGADSIVDVVNTYLGIALAYGVVGLALFVSFFASTLASAWRAMRSIRARNSDEYTLGRSLIASTIAILFTIATVSSIMNIPIIYWSIAGMCVAYVRMVRGSHPIEPQPVK